MPISTWNTYGKHAVVTQGTTIGATTQFMDSCGGGITQPGVWYTINGTGEIITVSTCSAGTEMDTMVSIFSGNCSGLLCVTGNDDSVRPNCSINARASRSSWTSDVGVIYYILVRGFQRLKPGNFELAIEGRMHNDECQYSHDLQVGGSVLGDTSATDVNLGPVLETCGYKKDDYVGEFAHLHPPRSPRGLWYKVVGTGSRLRASTCTDGSTVFRAHRIHVFQDSCGENCVGGEKAPRGCVSYEWDSSAGTTYYVVVHKTYTDLSLVDDDDDGNESLNDIPILDAPAPFELTVTEVDAVSVSRRGQLFD